MSAPAFNTYPLSRQSCVRCGSPEVVHLLIGMPALPDEVGGLPAWVHPVGCMYPGHDRECPQCQMQWQSDEDGTGMLIRAWPDLYALSDTETVGGVEGWLSEQYELDVYLEQDFVDHDPEVDIAVRIDVSGIGLQFPFTLAEMWQDLDDLHEAVESGMER